MEIDWNLILQNMLTPPVLYFFLGMAATFVKSDLEIPQPGPKLLSLYLLASIGFHGGVELRHGGVHTEVILTMAACMLMACFVPFYSYFILRIKLDYKNAAAIAATYGSVSAVTFITGQSFLKAVGSESSGHMIAGLALMESPAIIIGVLIYSLAKISDDSKRKTRSAEFKLQHSSAGSGAGGGPGEHGEGIRWGHLIQDAFFNGSVFLLVGSLVLGLITGDSGWKALKPFDEDIFKGLLSFFLLDMGLMAARRMGDLGRAGVFLISYAILVPILNAAVGIFLAKLIGMNAGNALLFCLLCASASYIAVPAAIRLAIPEANPSLYVPMALAITFPFNIILGIPVYYATIQAIGIKVVPIAAAAATGAGH